MSSPIVAGIFVWWSHEPPARQEKRESVQTESPSMTTESSTWPSGIGRLIEEARRDVEEVLATGRLSRAVRLVERTGIDFDPSYFPMYFTGAFEARFVLVHLNPKLSKRLSGAPYTNFREYFDAHRRFGYHHWEQDPTYRSAFDHKQVRFLRPFAVIDFLQEGAPGARRKNAALAIDAKLQLELVPYGSPSFPTRRIPADVLQPHFDRVLAAVAAFPRDYVMFCGAVFDDLLDQSGRIVSREDHRFRLPTTRGTSTNQYRFANVVIEHDGARLAAGIARSFAVQGLPMPEYAARCRDLYRAGE
jgi:hypothetical protein